MTTLENQKAENAPSRIKSLDILRGAVMILMAIDHVRVYSGIPAGSHEPGIFFTRWITHFCVPTFVFFAGTAAFLNGNRLRDTNKLIRFLLVRGLLLVLLEISIIRFFWTFNFDYSNFFLAGVIWMLGWCMVLLAPMVKLKPANVGYIGIAIVLFQQVFSLLPKLLPESFQPTFGKFWNFIYPSDLQGIDGISILYVLVPWIGVMAAGYGFGLIMLMNPEKRRRLCLRIGISATALFIIIGSILVFQEPKTNETPPFLLQLLNQRKYPASQLYLLMTLGPVIALIPYAERAKGWLINALSIFGRVPMFYYILHILVIHLSALLVTYLREGTTHPEWYASAPFTYMEDQFKWRLPLLYLIFLIDVVTLYFACRWFAMLKDRNKSSWLKFF